jgi:hypothetical protein
MIQVQILAVEYLTTILARVPVPLEDVMPCELDLFLRHPIKQHQQDHPRNADAERDRADAFGVRFLDGEIVPLPEIERLK